jgi:hypothetical protein
MKHNPFFNRNSMLVFIVLSVLVIGFADYATGCELGFFLFYLIAIAACKVGPTSSYLISILSAIVWFLSDIYSSPPYCNVFFAISNGIIRLLAFLTIVYSTLKIQFSVVKGRETSRDRLSQVKTLTGLVPICASCKKIRDDKGDWQRIEEYVEERTNAQFTHGLCPECVDKLLKEAPIDNLHQPAGHLLGTASKQNFPSRKSFRGRSQGVLLK